MSFSNVLWSGRFRKAEFGLLCDDCGKSLGDHRNTMCPVETLPVNPTTFEAHGHTWFRHTPGDPRPCDSDEWIYTLLSGNRLGSGGERYRAQYASWHCKDHKNSDIIGWRFADSAKPEVPQNIACGPKIVGVDFAEDESERNDLIAAVDDGHLTPGQKAYIQGKEDAQAAKQQLAKDAQDKALQERADQLADAGKAMDRVNQDHGHRLGWMQ